MSMQIKTLHQGNIGKKCIHCGCKITENTYYADNEQFYNTLLNLPIWTNCEATMQYYCLGFIFDANRDINLMIEKNRPKWQEGLHNGIGGKVENGENPIDAMVRECKEETGLEIPDEKWKYAGRLIGHGWKCNIYLTVYHDIHEARSMESEKVKALSTRELILGRIDTVSHSPALIQLCKMIMNDDGGNMTFTLDYEEKDRANEG